MNNENTFEVALTKCYLCGEGSDILMNTRLTEKNAKDIKRMDGKVVSTVPCTKCKDLMKERVLLIEVDNESSDEGWHLQEPPNPYRTGHTVWVTTSLLESIINDRDLFLSILDVRCSFMEKPMVQNLITNYKKQFPEENKDAHN